MRKLICCIIALLTASYSYTQILYNNGAVLTIEAGALITINGSFYNSVNSNTSNQGTINVKENFTNLSSISGNGVLKYSGPLSKTHTVTTQTQSGKMYLDSLCGEVTFLQQMLLNDTTYIGGGSVLNVGNFDLAISGYLHGNGSIKTNGNSDLTVNTIGNAGTVFMNQSVNGVTNRFENITLTNNASLTTGNITLVSKVVNVVSGNLNSSGNLVLLSDSITTARVAELNPGADITGNVTVQRYIPAVTRRSRILSSPVQNFSFSQFIDDIFITGTGGATNGFDVSPVNSATIYTYQEDTTGNGRGWKAITNINNTLDVANGALVFVRGDRTLNNWYTLPYPQQNKVVVDFTYSPINKGNISPTISYTNTGVIANDGWNMLGNPYPSPINWSCLAKNNLSPFYYTLNPLTGSYVANIGTSPIASGQGFFVQAIAANPSITFSENCKSTSTPTNYFKTGAPIVTAKLIKDSLNADILSLIFENGSIKNYNPSEDAMKLTNALINFAALVNADSVKLQYHKLPVLTQQTDTVYLYTSAPNGNYTIEFDGIATLSNGYDVLLHDGFTNSFVNLSNQSVYPFSITSNPASGNAKRFSLIFNKTSSLPVTLISFNGAKIKEDCKLKWITTSEKNLNSFVVQKSIDDKNWFDIGLVKAIGNTSAKNSYSFTDSGAFVLKNSTLSYRLELVNSNHSKSYSNNIIFNNNTFDDNNSLIQVYPNPASNWVNIDCNCVVLSSTLFDINGLEYKIKLENQRFDVSNLSSGIYMLKLNTDYGIQYVKLVKK